MIQINAPDQRQRSLSLPDGHSGCGKISDQGMLRRLVRTLVFCMAVIPVSAVAALADDRPANSAIQEFAPRGQRSMVREIKYSDWRKVCFKIPGTNMVCRTTISGTFDTGQSAVRIDLIEREGEGAPRLQFFLPVGLYLQAGVKVTVDQGIPYRIPYVWCLTNTCIAADRVDPKLIGAMESGRQLVLEVVDSSVLTVNTSLPLAAFAAVRHGAPTQVFEQTIDE